LCEQIWSIHNLTPQLNACIIERPPHSAFFQTKLELTLRKMNRDQVIVCGVFAHHGVMVSCIDGYVAQMCGSVSTVGPVKGRWRATDLANWHTAILLT
jgi:isochorismate hydrolase